MYSIERLKVFISELPLHEETIEELLYRIRQVENEFNDITANLDNKLAVVESELNAIRKMHENKYIMPFYDTLPSKKINTRDNIYELKLAVEGMVEQDAHRPVIALGVREYGQPENYAHQVWVDKFDLLYTKDRKLLIKFILQDMCKQVERVFNKETTRV